MSIVKDTFFGGAEKKAAKAQQQGIERGIEATNKATAQARQDVMPLFDRARGDLQQGFQGALDVFAQSLPAQMQAFQGGNVGAQEQLIAGLPLFQNAILGGNIDYSQLQPTQVQTPDLGFFSQTLPGLPSGSSPTGQLLANAFAPEPQFQTIGQGMDRLRPLVRGGDFQNALAEVNAGNNINREQVASLLAGTSGGNVWQR